MWLCTVATEVSVTGGSSEPATFWGAGLAAPLRRLKYEEGRMGAGKVSFKKSSARSQATAEKVAGIAQGKK